jgi:chemotaxis protein CheX
VTEGELKYFIEVVMNYFEQITGSPATMGLPFIRKDEIVVMDFTGIIGISGARKGGIYFTAGKGLLSKLTKAILDVEDPDDQTLLDMVGELCNTIAGNARKNFGSGFMISVPMVVRGKPQDIQMKLKPPVFIIPVSWGGDQGHLVVGLE